MNIFKKSLQETYKNNGFVLLKNYLTKCEANNVVNYINQIQHWKEEHGKWMIYYEINKDNKKIKSRIENYIEYHQFFKSFTHNKINPIVNFINNNNMVLFKDKINFKEAGGKGFKAHQDFPAWSDFPPTYYSTATLFANNSNSENGCLEFSPYNYNNGLLPYDISKGGHIDEDISNNLEWQFVETTPRDVVIFDSFVPHKSGPNDSLTERRNVYLTYNMCSEGDYYNSYVSKKRIEFPPEIDREANKDYSVGTKYNLANPIN